jgi:hypothetical protein
MGVSPSLKENYGALLGLAQCQSYLFLTLSTQFPRTSGGFVARCKSQITKQVELRFQAVLGDGAREVRFEGVLVR